MCLCCVLFACLCIICLRCVSKLENEISDYIKFALPFCINEENYVGLTITKQDPDVETKINQDTVEVSANLPLSIIKDDINVKWT